MKCLVCNENEARLHPILGYLPCDTCAARNKSNINTPVEFVPESTKQDRKKYADDIMQSSRGGVLNKPYIEKYGADHLNVTQEQIDNAQDVYAGDISSRPYREPDGKVI